MNVKRYRGNVEIVRDILKAARVERIQNEIIYHANLNTVQFKRYSDTLVECGYLEKRKGSWNVTYQTTSKGLEAIEALKGASLVIEEVKKHLK